MVVRVVAAGLHRALGGLRAARGRVWFRVGARGPRLGWVVLVRVRLVRYGLGPRISDEVGAIACDVAASRILARLVARAVGGGVVGSGRARPVARSEDGQARPDRGLAAARLGLDRDALARLDRVHREGRAVFEPEHRVPTQSHREQIAIAEVELNAIVGHLRDRSGEIREDQRLLGRVTGHARKRRDRVAEERNRTRGGSCAGHENAGARDPGDTHRRRTQATGAGGPRGRALSAKFGMQHLAAPFEATGGAAGAAANLCNEAAKSANRASSSRGGPPLRAVSNASAFWEGRRPNISAPPHRGACGDGPRHGAASP